jgi:DNA polymerase-3 subunit alpha (Gram-positive type)
MVKSIFGIKKIPAFKVTREDTAPEKRVELHCHTKMSDMDAVSSATSIISQAYHFGMHALAITDTELYSPFRRHTKPSGGNEGFRKTPILR